MRKRRDDEPESTWTLGGVLWGLVKFPFQALAVLVAFVMLFSWIFLAWLPWAAASARSDLFFFSLRCFDFETDRPANPLFLLQGNTLATTAFDLRKPAQPGEKRAYTPEVARESKALVGKLWDLNDPEQRQRIQDWGDSLLRLGLYQASHGPLRMPPVDNPSPATEDEAHVMVSMAILGVHPKHSADLPRLEELAIRAYPNSKDRDAALAWAGTLYDRMEKLNADFQEELRLHGRTEKAHLSHQRISAVLPPRTPTTLWWLVYQYVGLTPETQQECVAHYKKFFSSTFQADALALGEQIERERRASGEPLPPASPALPWLCLVERYHGLDRKGEQDRAALTAFYSRSSLRLTRGALQGANPNDDYFFMLAGGNDLHLIEERTGDGIGFMVLVILMVVYGLRLLTFSVIAEFFLRLHHNRLYREYRNGRGHGSFWVRLIGYVGIPLVAWGFTFFTMSSTLRPLAGSSLSLLLGSFLAVLLGGAFVGFLTRMVALLFLRAEVDVNRIWWDEIIGLTLGLGLLAYFGNDLINLAIFAAAELLPMCLQPHEPEMIDPDLVQRIS